ncbi:MAG TPA: HD domain-containing protein [Patescibacteria group bacterium]|nr:HD domain-containing protein [Patescibacteria group bacterium]
MAQPDITRLIAMQKMLLQFQAIDRALYIPDRGERHENDVEHSYNLAMAAWFLATYFAELDRDLVIRMALVHDLVELHAGDTFPFHNESEVATKQQREEAALEKIREDWSDFAEMTECMQLYEERSTPEAKFVYALDKVMPAIMNLLQGGAVWRERNITLQDIRALKDDKVALSPEIIPYYHQLLELLQKNPQLFSPAKGTGKQRQNLLY